MKKLLLIPALAMLFGACSTATLININVDGDSFLATDKRAPPPLIVLNGQSYNSDIPDGGLTVPLPNLSFLTKIALKINVGVVSSAAGAINGTIQLFVAPSSGTLFDPANKVPTGANCTGDLPVDGTNPVGVDLSLSATSPAPCSAAFTRVQSGQFRIGARVAFAVTANSTVTITLNNLDVGVSGYPVQIIK